MTERNAVERLTLEEIRAELLSTDEEVRAEFLRHFGSELRNLIESLYGAYYQITEFSSQVTREKRAAYVEAFLLAALNNVLTSSKLLVSGLLLPAGNLMRSFNESVAMALLTSHRLIRVYEELDRLGTRYPVHRSIQKLSQRRNLKRLKIEPALWTQWQKITSHYNQYSHSSYFALAAQAKFSQPGTRILGSDFDEAKVPAYRQELRGRISAADALENLVPVLVQNVLDAQKRD